MLVIRDMRKKNPKRSAFMASKKLVKRAHLRRIKQKEYQNLKNILPAVCHKKKVKKVTLIEEAIRHIEELHQAIAQRLEIDQHIGHNSPLGRTVISNLVLAMNPSLSQKSGLQRHSTPVCYQRR